MDSRTAREARMMAEEYRKSADLASAQGDLTMLKHALMHYGVYLSLAIRLEQEEAKAGPFAPFKAWVVVDKDGKTQSGVIEVLNFARQKTNLYDERVPEKGPHRVVPVLVTPVKED